MNKFKFVPMLVVAPMLFACGNKSNLNGSYIINKDSFTYAFEKGDEANYNAQTNKRIFKPINEFKDMIYDCLTAYAEEGHTEDHGVHFSNDPMYDITTVDGKKLTAGNVNYHKIDDVTSSYMCDYAKDGDVFHFYGSYTDGHKAKEWDYKEQRDYASDVSVSYLMCDNGFNVDGNKMTINTLLTFKINDSEAFKINTTYIANK